MYVKALHVFATFGPFRNWPAHFEAAQLVLKVATHFIGETYGMKFYML